MNVDIEQLSLISNYYGLCENDFYPPEDRRSYGIKGNRYDSVSEYRSDFYKYINENS